MRRKWADWAAIWTPAGFAAAMLVGFHTLVLERMASDTLAVGHYSVEISPAYGRFVGVYLFFGLAATGGLVLAFHRGLLARRLEVQAAQLRHGGDRRYVLIASLAAFALAVVCHRLVLLGMPLTDDEYAYRFAAQILAEGRLALPASPDEAFRGHVFVVNEGRTFTQYFLGWPALMLPALLVGLEGYANAFYFALAMPAIFLVLRRLTSSFWARVGLLLALSSPMLLISAGTLLSHISCFTALAWCLYFALRCSDEGSHWAWHSAFSLAFSAAFFIRPLSAAAIGLPLLCCWAWQWLGRADKARALLAMALPAGGAALLFLTVNTLMNGFPLRTAYDSYIAFRAGGREPSAQEQEVAWISAGHSISVAAAAFHRLGFAALGWPVSWLFVFFAGKAPGRRRILAMIPCFFAFNLPVVHVGIDTYAPMHYIELALAIVILTVLGLERLTAAARDHAAGLAKLPLLIAGTSLLIHLAGLLPYQIEAVHTSTVREKQSRDATAGLPRPAVLFVHESYDSLACFRAGLGSWVRQWPISAPDWEEDLLWLSHVSLERDRELMARRFPGRHGFGVARDETCRLFFVPIEEATQEDLPPARSQRAKPPRQP
jgi:hypothetical protein